MLDMPPRGKLLPTLPCRNFLFSSSTLQERERERDIKILMAEGNIGVLQKIILLLSYKREREREEGARERERGGRERHREKEKEGGREQRI